MQTSNNYDKEVFNGDIGVIEKIDKVAQEVTITFDQRDVIYEYSELDEFIHAYATTIHKSQVSEYPIVIVPLTTQHYRMLQRNLLYTAITRAKKLIILIGQKKALSIAVKTASASRRYSTFKKRLVELTEMY